MKNYPLSDFFYSAIAGSIGLPLLGATAALAAAGKIQPHEVEWNNVAKKLESIRI